MKRYRIIAERVTKMALRVDPDLVIAFACTATISFLFFLKVF